MRSYYILSCSDIKYHIIGHTLEMSNINELVGYPFFSIFHLTAKINFRIIWRDNIYHTMPPATPGEGYLKLAPCHHVRPNKRGNGSKNGWKVLIAFQIYQNSLVAHKTVFMSTNTPCSVLPNDKIRHRGWPLICNHTI